MSFKLPVTILNKKEFIQAVRRLNKARLPFGMSFKVKTLSTKLDAAMDEVTEKYTEIIKKRVKLDEKGNILPKTLEEDVKDHKGKVVAKAGDVIPNSYVPIDDKHESALRKEVDDLMNGGIEIKFSKLPMSALEKVEVSAEELEYLEYIVDITDEVKNNVVRINK